MSAGLYELNGVISYSLNLEKKYVHINITNRNINNSAIPFMLTQKGSLKLKLVL